MESSAVSEVCMYASSFTACLLGDGEIGWKRMKLREKSSDSQTQSFCNYDDKEIF